LLLTGDMATALEPGMHGCTFGGGALAATTALWTLERVRRPAFLARVQRAGRKLAKGLSAVAAAHPCLRETRGLGLPRAIDLDPSSGVEPQLLIAAARARGLLLVRGGESAVRLLPPLTVR